eukprot:UN05832
MAHELIGATTFLMSEIESECEAEGLEVSVTNISDANVSTESDGTIPQTDTVNQAEDSDDDGMMTIILAAAVAGLFLILVGHRRSIFSNIK